MQYYVVLQFRPLILRSSFMLELRDTYLCCEAEHDVQDQSQAQLIMMSSWTDLPLGHL
jgi:hypothetical protein